jgi:hypothetical protein
MERANFAAALKGVKLEGFVWPDPDDAGDLRIIKNVIECGCHIIAVEKELGHPEFAYSIGLHLNYLHPEVVVVEMDRALAGRSINRIAERLKTGERFSCGVPYEGLHDSLPLVFRELRMEDHTDELGFAIWFYCSRSSGLRFPVCQAMWPDRSGRFPTDPQCDPGVIRAQKLRRK